MIAATAARLAPARWLHLPRPTARLRLTALYGALFLLSGAVLLTVTYLLFARTTTFITLPGGEKVMFGSLNGSPSPPATATYQRDGTIRSQKRSFEDASSHASRGQLIANGYSQSGKHARDDIVTGDGFG